MIPVDGPSLTTDHVVAVARGGEPAVLGAAAKRAVQRSRKAVERLMQKGDLAYGIKTGFGQLESVSIPEEEVRELQRNLVRSHAVGVGRPLAREQVRAALLLRANALARGLSGGRVEEVRRLRDHVDSGVV